MPPKAKKDTTVLIINIGVTHHGAEINPTLLEKEKQIATRIIEKKIFLRPNEEIGVILMGTTIKSNSLDIDHIREYTNIQIANWNIIEKIMHLTPTTHCSNWIEAVYVALDYIKTNCLVTNNSSIKLFLLSDFNEDSDVISSFEADEIIKDIRAQNIQLHTIGEESLDEKPENHLKPSELLLKNVLEKIEGHHVTFDSALSELRFYNEVSTIPMPWHSNLELIGKEIPISTYVKVTDTNKFPPWKHATGGQIIEPVRQYMDRQRETYKNEEIVRGYKYGEKFIPLDKKIDEHRKLEESMSYKSGVKSYRIYSFTNKDNIDLEYWCTCSTRVVVPRNKQAAKPFYSLVQAMVKTNLVAIVRKVYALNYLPKMVALFPSIKVPEEPWCLVEVELPFAEDRRVIEPKPIKSIVKKLTSEQNEVVDDLLESLQIADAESSYEDGTQCFLPGYLSNPAAQHRWNTLSYRALNPKAPVPPMEDHLKDIFEVPSVQDKSQIHFEKIATLFQLDSIEPKRKRKADFVLKNIASQVKNNDNTNSGQIPKTADKSEIDDENDSFADPVLSLDISDVDFDDLVANI